MKKFKPILKFIIVVFLVHLPYYVFFEDLWEILYLHIVELNPLEVTNVMNLMGDILTLLSILLIWKMGLVDLRSEFKNGWSTLTKMKLPIFAGVLWFWADGVLLSLLDLEMTEEYQDYLFDKSLHSPFLVFQTCFGKPLLEELLIRTACLGLMLRSGIKPWVAVFVSSIAFGVIHSDFSQIVFAGIGGLMLGFIYYKTNNIFATMIIHSIQNTLATIIAFTSETTDDFQNVQDCSSDDSIGMFVLFLVVLVFASASILIMKRFCSKFPQPQFVKSVESDEPVMEEC